LARDGVQPAAKTAARLVTPEVSKAAGDRHEDFLPYVGQVGLLEPIAAAPAVHQGCTQANEPLPGRLISRASAIEQAQGGVAASLPRRINDAVCHDSGTSLYL
jgi:hypothetical protein